MQFIKAEPKDLDSVYEIVSETVKQTYIECYNQEIVDFFLWIHSKENIERDIKEHSMYLIKDNGHLVGTGCAKNNEITRVYILPEYHGRGLGTGIMDLLESEISKKYKSVTLSPSLIAVDFYKRRGYYYTKHDEHEIGGMILAHDTMQKDF